MHDHDDGPPGDRAQRFLIVDDDPVALMVLERLLAAAGYHDVRAISRDPLMFCSSRGVLVNDPLRFAPADMSGSVLHTDPPDHSFGRKWVNRESTPRGVAHFEPRILEPGGLPIGPIGRGIVDHEDVEIVRAALRQDAGDALGDVRLCVVGLDEEADVHGVSA